MWDWLYNILWNIPNIQIECEEYFAKYSQSLTTTIMDLKNDMRQFGEDLTLRGYCNLRLHLISPKATRHSNQFHVLFDGNITVATLKGEKLAADVSSSRVLYKVKYALDYLSESRLTNFEMHGTKLVAIHQHILYKIPCGINIFVLVTIYWLTKLPWRWGGQM